MILVCLSDLFKILFYISFEEFILVWVDICMIYLFYFILLLFNYYDLFYYLID